MSGPEFLFFYVILFFLIFVALTVLRRLGFDKPIYTLAAIVLFLGIGAARWLIGSAEGLHKWTFLVVMMVLGPVFFFVRLHSSKGGPDGGGGGCSSCSGGSGCGSGGGSSCGGGGCGGCGGS